MYVVDRKNDHLTEKGFLIIQDIISKIKSRRD